MLRADLGALLGPERFQREIRLAARLQHPNILPVYDSGTGPTTRAAGARPTSGSRPRVPRTPWRRRTWFELARTRTLLARAHAALGDGNAAAMEKRAAIAITSRIGAAVLS